MKKHLGLITLLSLLSGYTADGQQKKAKRAKTAGYMRIGIGYNMPTAAQRNTYNMSLNGTMMYNDYGLGDYNIKKASFSAGLQANAAFGIMLNKNIGLELNNIIGLMPEKYTATLQYPDNGYTITESYTKSTKGLFLMVPSLVLQHGNKVQLYIRAGVVLPVVTRMENQFAYKAFYSGAAQNISGSETIKNNFNAGFSGAIGMKGEITKGLTGWVEFNYLSLTLNTNKAELDEYYVNGQNVTSRVTNPTRQYSPTSANANTTSPTIVYPFSSMGLHLGIAFTF